METIHLMVLKKAKTVKAVMLKATTTSGTLNGNVI